ncbi:RNA 2',3'-cyclic phosphodiesterase [Maritimibacter sp. HL-12]|uniref:RNA 2',3'-cyclic phosphodiesterase n=1 Tax=Maritimibacter sp. HL-12 TaxID=1162418 RepID=UPI000A0EEE2A|nr:RNA 2',3'-cyclic phosphodiesterase [Maritimibacter sp. HL-12]SMH34673.1 2'-5' RNA ligase [Maritimibacter sp. HL-12]
MRAFIALDLPDVLADALTRLQAGLTVGRVLPEENLHLTLAFLGEISEPQARDVAELLASLRLAPVRIELGGLDLFGGRRPGALVIAARGEGLAPLHDKVAHAVRDAGVTLGRRRFRPHVTLARLPRDMPARDRARLGEFLALNGAVKLPPALAESLTLFRSHLRAEGAIHEPLAEFPLGNQETP